MILFTEVKGVGNVASGLVLKEFYDTFKSMLAIFGLTPRTLAYLIGTIVVVAIVAQLRAGLKGNKSWSLDDPQEDFS